MRTILATVFAGIILITITACTSVPPVNGIPEVIANAKTAADHQRIADYFAQKAASYEAEAKIHETMPQSYRRNTVRSETNASMIAHCRELQKQLNAASQEAKALEQAHRELGALLK